MISTLIKKGWILFIAVFLALLFTQEGIRHTAASFVFTVQKPFSQATESISHVLSDLITQSRSKASLDQENENLRKEVERLSNESALSSDFFNDYRELLTVTGMVPPEGTIARIIPSISSRLFDMIIINKGAADGIQKGMKVTLDNTIFIGFVEEVLDSRSRIRLLSFAGQETQLKLAETKSTIIAKGAGSGMMTFTLPRDFPLNPGSHVLFMDKTPLLAGFIEDIDDPGADATVTIRAVIPFNPQGLSLVILLP